MASERPGLTGETPTPPDGAGAAAAADCYSLTEVVTTSQLLEDLGGYVITLWVVVGLEVLFLYGLLAKTLWSVYHNERLPKLWRSGTVWANSVPSFVALMCLGSLIVPASDRLLRAVRLIYLSVSLSKFVELCLLYFGGESRLLAAVEGSAVPLAVPPCCCCCRPCCPRPTITKRSIRVMKVLVYQLPFSVSGYFFFSLYLYSAGMQNVGEASGGPGYVILMALHAVAFLLGMYGLIMLETTTKGQLQSLRYRAKFALMKFTVVIINIQKFIFSIVISTGGFTCTASMSPEVYGAFILNIVIAAEMLLFGVLNHWAYQADGRSADDLTAADLTPSGSPADRADTPTSQQTWTSTAQRENVGAKTTNGFSGA
ncbi:organic solute transporter subunit alpha-like isoform X1 [Amphibalanus amphitrite]|uniref:organic solute transporter subunit alpha-like isoform X1 n=1 Tax=Amphibalanus amphitrite TaxID=1232801 RepID=UPI001C913309|nr:organic solute transporter subunit alpha-like isoform X1 [Amphibalanus amphitrite]XP_043196214.1 organic solute transporter subunit alpha-like isoform X1 [Amphibalanus amphitrite]XP_043196215.1 organic solute transporter subunit alpha-like isoform X1 [Amphibalanus amphitrite]